MPNIFTFIIQNVSLGVGLAMDAFSVSVTDGLKEHDMRRSRAFFIAGIYGGFQFLMPLIGWGCVQLLEQLFASFQRFIPWIALGLLLFLGVKMIRESLHREEEEDASAAARKSTGTLLLQGVATSIDALSVGFTIADSPATRIFKEELYSLYTDKINHVTLVPVCGGSMHAFFRAAKSYVSSMNYVGVDADMTADKDYCVFSTLKHIDKVILDYIGMWLNHSMPKHKRMGFADGLTDVVLGNYTYNTSLSQLNVDSLRQVAIRKEGERYAK